jgi:hypothetical protein
LAAKGIDMTDRPGHDSQNLSHEMAKSFLRAAFLIYTSMRVFGDAKEDKVLVRIVLMSKIAVLQVLK